MEHKVAANALIAMLDKHQFKSEEKQAVLTAIGVLAWTSLAESKIKNLKVKRDKLNLKP